RIRGLQTESDRGDDADMRKPTNAVCVAAFCLVPLACSQGSPDRSSLGTNSAPLTTSLWASPAGIGTACSQTSPCSVTQAQTTVPTLNANMTDNIVVNLLDGTYELSAPLSFGAADSGHNNFSVIWQAAPHAVPVLSGGIRITGWTATPSKPGVFQAS